MAMVRPGAVLFAPTLVRGVVMGGIFLVWWPPGRAFPPGEIRLVEGIASQVGLAVENAERARQTPPLRGGDRPPNRGDLEECLDRRAPPLRPRRSCAAPGSAVRPHRRQRAPDRRHHRGLVGARAGLWRARARAGGGDGEPGRDRVRERPPVREERSAAFRELTLAQGHLVRTEKLRALGEMAAGVSHDFNNLLAVIVGIRLPVARSLPEPTPRGGPRPPGAVRPRPRDRRRGPCARCSGTS
jgi:signal transduction histidine kinase